MLKEQLVVINMHVLWTLLISVYLCKCYVNEPVFDGQMYCFHLLTGNPLPLRYVYYHV